MDSDPVWFPSCFYLCRILLKEKSERKPVAPVAQRLPCNLLTRWDVSSIPANGIFLTKKILENKNKNVQRVENTKFDFTDDEGKEWLDSSREKK